jgi:hypothetical protein
MSLDTLRRSWVMATKPHSVTTHTAMDSDTTTIGSLPPELLLSVLSWTDPKTLLTAVGRVCRAWRAAAEEVRGIHLDLRFLGPNARLRRALSDAVGVGMLSALCGRFRWATEVTLEDFYFLEDAGVLTVIEQCPELQHINVTGCYRLTDAVHTPLAEYGHGRIPSSARRDAALTDPAVIALAKQYPRLQSVDFIGARWLTDVGVVALAQHCPGLKTVSFEACREVSPIGIIALAEHCPGLRSVNLAEGPMLSDAAVTALAERCPGLEALNFKRNSLSTAVVATLAQHCPRLRVLILFDCDLTDAAVRALAEGCRVLESIDLYQCPRLTDAAMDALAQHCPKLRYVNVADCPGVSEAATTMLVARCPALDSVVASTRGWGLGPSSDHAVKRTQLCLD